MHQLYDTFWSIYMCLANVDNVPLIWETLEKVVVPWNIMTQNIAVVSSCMSHF